MTQTSILKGLATEHYTGIRNRTESLGQEEGRAVGNQKVVHYKQQQSVS